MVLLARSAAFTGSVPAPSAAHTRWQVGAAGYYLRQFEDDIRGGAAVAPDGRRSEVLSLGGVLNYDIPEYKAAIKFKARSSVFAYNTAMVSAFYLTFAKKLEW